MSEFITRFRRPHRHETRTHNIALYRKIIMIGVLLSHETRIHNIALKSVSIMIGVLTEEKRSNERAT